VDAAWIAVVGTLAGVAITAGAGLVTASQSAKHQRDEALRQAQEDDHRRLRDERRAVFVEYLLADDAMFGRALVIAEEVRGGLRVSATPDQARDHRHEFERHARDEVAAVYQAYLTLTITAGVRTREVAEACHESLWALGAASIAGRDSSAFREAESAANEPRHQLREAMRAELGVD
jgi:gas vesicle protein